MGRSGTHTHTHTHTLFVTVAWHWNPSASNMDSQPNVDQARTLGGAGSGIPGDPHDQPAQFQLIMVLVSLGSNAGMTSLQMTAAARGSWILVPVRILATGSGAAGPGGTQAVQRQDCLRTAGGS